MGDLFEIQTVKGLDEGKYTIKQEKQDGYVEFVGRTKTNNGIKGYMKRIDIEPNPAKVISISQIGTIVAQIRKEERYGSQNIFALSPKNDNYKLLSLSVLSTINKLLTSKFSGGYSNYPTLKKLENTKIQLPVKNGEIDFEFMEYFIAELEAERLAELEAERLAELEAYLAVTGLKDAKLTSSELKAIDEFESGKIEWGGGHLINLFDVKNSRNILSRDIVEKSGTTPYLCASCENNGVSSYISYNREYLDQGNCIFIGGKTFVVSYQEQDFFSNDSHNLILYLKDGSQREKLQQLFFVTCIYKGLNHKYSRGNSVSNKKIQEDKIVFPCKKGEPDYEFMKLLISAVQKLVIKDVITYTEQKIAFTKLVIQNHRSTIKN